MKHIGEDPDREGVIDTPARVVKSWNEIFAGYKQDPAKILERRFDAAGYDEMVILRGITFYSTCEHHMLPFHGVAHVGYLPGKSVVGLSKLARLVNCFSRRMQIQEKMTREIADTLERELGAAGVGVVIEATHLCMVARGVRQGSDARMVTSALLGRFREPEMRAEFLNLIGRQ